MRSGRAVVLLLLFALFTALSLTVIGWLSYQINQSAEKSFQQQIDSSPYKDDLDPAKVKEQKAKILRDAEDQKKKYASVLFSSDDQELGETLKKIPLVLLLVFKLTTIFLPLFIALMGFDQISAEIGPRSIRYLVIRARRSSIVVGKVLSQASLLALLTLLCVIAMCVVGKVVDPDFTVGAMFASMLKFWLIAVIFSTAYLALTSACSAAFRVPPISLAINLIALFVIWFVGLVGATFRPPGEVADTFSLSSIKPESYLAYVKYGSIWHYSGDLLSPDWARLAIACAAHLGFAGLLMGTAYILLRARDV